MKYKRVLLFGLLLSGMCLTIGLQAQSTLNVAPVSGEKSIYSLSSLRKLVFPSSGTVQVSKTDGSVDTFALNATRYLIFANNVTETISPKQDLSSIQIFPNPVTDMLNIRLPLNEGQPMTVELLSIDGKMLYKQQIMNTGTPHQINVSALRRGLYLCRVNSGTGVEMVKFLKQ